MRSHHYVASRYYSSQWSKGYAKLSQLARMRYEPGLASFEKTKGSDDRNAAAALLWRKRKEIRLTG